MVADVAQCRFGVFERYMAVSVGQAVFEYDGRNAVRSKPLPDLVPFAPDDDQAVTAARADDDGLSSRFRRIGGVNIELGLGDVVKTTLFFGFRCRNPVGVGRRGVVPQFDHLDLGGGGQRRREGDERQQSFHGYRGLEVGF